MGVIAKYKFNQNIYANFIPEFNSGFTDYTITDEIDTDGKTIRTIESDSLPTSIKFGYSNKEAENDVLSLEEINYLNISNITSLVDLCASCKNLIKINTENWDTSQITSMCTMFYKCHSLTSLNISNFNTNKVTNMTAMFFGCSSLISLDVSNFNTSQVTNMSGMFQDCSSLVSLDVSNFNTSQVTTMSTMFHNCNKLTSLDVSNFNTSQVTTMNSMFNKCSSLTSLDISNFNTSQVTNMNNMFSGCSSLTSLDVLGFNTEKVTDMSGIFHNCSLLTFLDVSNFNTKKVTDMSYMFRNCPLLTFLDISNFNTEKVNNMYVMFQYCTSLTSLDLSNFNTEKVTNMNSMFSNCSSLTSLDISSFNTEKVADMDSMFANCLSLTSLDVSNFRTEEMTNMNNMFNYCHKLIDVGMIYCNSLTINKVSSLITTNTKIYYSLPDISELEPHNNVEYIKYIFPTKVQLPPHIQLHSLPDGTCDELDVKTGILTRKLEIVKIDETDSITKENSRLFRIYKKLSTANQVLDDRSKTYISWKYRFLNNYNYDSNKTISYHPNVQCFFIQDSGIKTIEEFKKKLKYNPMIIMYKMESPTIEKLILNYNNSCNYDVILPRGTSDNYNVITNEYKQNLDFIPIDGSIAFDTATIKDTTVKFSVAISKFEVDTTNVRGSDGIYCDNNLFKYEASDNDYEHAYTENDTTLHIYVNKSRLSSYDQVGFQLYLTSNPFNIYYAMRTPIISYVNYEDLDPEKASWEMLDCMEDESITIESGNMDKTLLLDCLDYVAPTKNRFEIDLLKTNTQYTIYAEGVSGSVQLNFGGNIVNFTSGNIYTSGETQLVEFYTDSEIKNLIIIEGDTRNETINFFEGLKSSENITVISSNAPFVFGKGGKIQ